MKAIEGEQHARLLQRFVVLHHCGNGLRDWAWRRSALSYPLGIISIMNRIVVYLACGQPSAESMI